MPIHDLGYRRWRGSLAPSWVRFWTIAKSGIKVYLRNKWILFILLCAWIPLMPFAAFFFAYEQQLKTSGGFADEGTARRHIVAEMASGTPDSDVVRSGLLNDDPAKGRHTIWSFLMYQFLRIPQAISAMLVVGMLAPPLIARDIRTRAFLLYFSRPINRYEYVLGKIIVVGAFLSFITMGPVLVCYLFGIALSSEPSAIFHTWDLPIRAVISSLVFILPAVSVALMFSSLSAESRFAGFAWFATWGLGAVAWLVMYGVMLATSSIRINTEFQAERQAYLEEKAQQEQSEVEEALSGNLAPLASVINEAVEDATEESVLSQNGRWRDYYEREMYVDGFGEIQFADPREAELERRRQEKLMKAQERIENHPLSLVSMYHTLVRLQRWIFGLESDFGRVAPSLVITGLMTIGSLMILLRRVAAPTRV